MFRAAVTVINRTVLDISSVCYKFTNHQIPSKLLLRSIMSTKTKQAKLSHDNKNDRLIWVDLEMSGLDVSTEHILESAVLITDGQLNIIAEGPGLIIHQPDSVLDNMDDWCKKHHGESGLTAAVRRSTISIGDAERQMLDFVKQHTAERVCPLAGNSVSTDREFLHKYMPKFTNHLHYRIVDVSSVKELCRRWYHEAFHNAPRKKLSHRALDDIKESIQELKYYKKTIFK